MSGLDERCPVCDRVGANCPTLEVLVRATVPQSEARRIALAAMSDCRAHAVDWRARAIATTEERDRLRVAVAKVRASLRTLIDHFDAMDGEEDSANLSADLTSIDEHLRAALKETP